MYEEERKRREWKMGVVESLVTGRDNEVRGATVRVVTKGKSIRLSRPVQKHYIRWSFGAKGREYKHLLNANGIQKFRQEESLLEMRPSTS